MRVREQGYRGVEVTPTRPVEARLFSSAGIADGIALVVVRSVGRDRLTAYVSPEELRVMRDLYDALATRMEAMQRAETSVSGARAGAPISAGSVGMTTGAGHQNNGSTHQAHEAPTTRRTT